MDTLIAFLPAVACGALMLFCMRGMSMGSKHETQQGQDQASKQEIAELREEIARLRAEQALNAGDVEEEAITR